jgi:hypothetical protein
MVKATIEDLAIPKSRLKASLNHGSMDFADSQRI